MERTHPIEHPPWDLKPPAARSTDAKKKEARAPHRSYGRSVVGSYNGRRFEP
jgi:hypothetical protein